jgi:hypothetical protein
MPLSFPVAQDRPQHPRPDGSDPWGDLRRYEQAKADGTAQEASFDDLLDVVNPLHHIPVVSTVYRELSGDTIQGAARIMGGGLYGGIGGFAGALVNAVAEEATGRDLGEHVMVAAGLSDDTPADAAATQVAEADPAAANPAAAGQIPAPAAVDVATVATPTAAAAAPSMAQPQPQAAAAGADTTTAAGPHAAGAQPAGAAAGGALTGLAALQAFARDTSQAAAAAQADRSAGNRAGADPRPAQQASAAAPGPAGGPSDDAARRAPASFMPLGDRAALINPRTRTSTAALAAQADPIGHRRLQGDPRAVPAPRTAAPAAAGESAPTAAAVPAPAAAPADARPAQGDLAERMMRALNKYEAMRRND